MFFWYSRLFWSFCSMFGYNILLFVLQVGHQLSWSRNSSSGSSRSLLEWTDEVSILKSTFSLKPTKSLLFFSSWVVVGSFFVFATSFHYSRIFFASFHYSRIFFRCDTPTTLETFCTFRRGSTRKICSRMRRKTVRAMTRKANEGFRGNDKLQRLAKEEGAPLLLTLNEWKLNVTSKWGVRV